MFGSRNRQHKSSINRRTLQYQARLAARGVQDRCHATQPVSFSSLIFRFILTLKVYSLSLSLYHLLETITPLSASSVLFPSLRSSPPVVISDT